MLSTAKAFWQIKNCIMTQNVKQNNNWVNLEELHES